jgi:hypothetical protein
MTNVKTSLLYIVLILLISFQSNIVSGQTSKNPGEEVNTIILVIPDSILNRTEIRFITFLRANGYQLNSISNQRFNHTSKIENTGTSSGLPTLTKIKPSSNHQLKLNEKEYYETTSHHFSDVMNGPFGGELAFKFEKENNKIKIVIWGYVQRHNMLSDKKNLRMQNKGKGLNWAQKSMFKTVDKLMRDFPGFEEITYSMMDN